MKYHLSLPEIRALPTGSVVRLPTASKVKMYAWWIKVSEPDVRLDSWVRYCDREAEKKMELTSMTICSFGVVLLEPLELLGLLAEDDHGHDIRG